MMNTRSSMSCKACRKRKIRCDRQTPTCSTCIISSCACIYPTHAQKPGPKPRRKLLEDIATQKSHDTPRADVLAGYSDEAPLADDAQADSSTLLQTRTSSACMIFSESQSNQLSQIMYPSQDGSDELSGRWNSNTRGFATAAEQDAQIMGKLQVSPDVYRYLIQEYFNCMTTFSLFHIPTFDQKLDSITSATEKTALLAAMFQYSARLSKDYQLHEESLRGYDAVNDQIPQPEHFELLAHQFIGDAIEEQADEIPTLCLLQASILHTFNQLAQKVRGRGWRSVGDCVRMAYEQRLHHVDSDRCAADARSYNYDKAQWIRDEERRRAWWAIWELDIFASTIRRLPTGIHALQNETWLPVDDDSWFAGNFRPSCQLDLDPSTRWKTLKHNGNISWKAWYIVVNSMMRDAHLLSHLQGTYGIIECDQNNQKPGISASRWTLDRSPSGIDDGLAILKNSLCCFEMALPPSIKHQNGHLRFTPGGSEMGKSTIGQDCAKHSIHVMIQLTKFMVNYYEIFWASQKRRNHTSVSASQIVNSSSQGGQFSETNATTQKSWLQCLEAADSILNIVRHSSPFHVRYVNPLFASTIWLAAATHIVCKVFHPVPQNPRVAQSKLDLLQTNFSAYVTFWHTSDVLRGNLENLESQLESLKALQVSNLDARAGSEHHPRQSSKGGDQLGAELAGCSDQHHPVPSDVLYGDSVGHGAGDNHTFTDAFGSYNSFGFSADMLNHLWSINQMMETPDLAFEPTSQNTDDWSELNL